MYMQFLIAIWTKTQKIISRYFPSTEKFILFFVCPLLNCCCWLGSVFLYCFLCFVCLQACLLFHLLQDYLKGKCEYLPEVGGTMCCAAMRIKSRVARRPAFEHSVLRPAPPRAGC